MIRKIFKAEKPGMTPTFIQVINESYRVCGWAEQDGRVTMNDGCSENFSPLKNLSKKVKLTEVK